MGAVVATLFRALQRLSILSNISLFVHQDTEKARTPKSKRTMQRPSSKNVHTMELRKRNPRKSSSEPSDANTECEWWVSVNKTLTGDDYAIICRFADKVGPSAIAGVEKTEEGTILHMTGSKKARIYHITHKEELMEQLNLY